MASAQRTRTWLFVLGLLAGCGNALDTKCKLGCPAGTHGAATNDRRGCACVNDVDADVADADVADADMADAEGE